MITFSLRKWTQSLQHAQPVSRVRRRNALRNRAVARQFSVENLETRVLLTVTQLGAASAGQLANSGTLSSFTVDAGTNRLLVVTASDSNATDVTGVTFNGMALTQAVERSDAAVAVDSIWYLALGTSGSSTTGNIVMTSNAVAGTHERYLAAVSFAGVNQGTPISGAMSAAAQSGNSSLNVSSAVGDLVYDVFDTFHNSFTPTVNIGGGQTQVATASGAITSGPTVVSTTSANGFGKYVNSLEAGASSVTMSWTSDAVAMIHAAVNIQQAVLLAADFGDAPAPYPTTLAENGARHVTTGPTLGATRDSEADGTHSANADADGADEDGITAAGPLVVGQTTNITINASAPGFVNAWSDLNRDGDWNDPGEQFLTNFAVVAGNNVIPFSIPANFPLGPIVNRHRLTSASVASPSPTGLLPDGEVEDYLGAIVEASSLIVTTNSDVVDPFDNLTSLREAIAFAASNPGADTITFGNGSAISGGTNFTNAAADTITLGGTQLAIASDVTITGTGANRLIINGNAQSRIFEISSGRTVTLSGMKITNGRSNGGGGIRNYGTLTVDACWIHGNAVPGISDNGGGIQTFGTLTVSGSTMSGNTAGTFGGGIDIGDGGIDFSSHIYTTTIINSTITGNSAANGGGVFATNGTLTITNTTIANNSANFPALFLFVTNAAVTNSAVDGNIGSDTSTLTNHSGNLLGVNGQFAPLDNYGGPMPTMIPLPGSPAINNGVNSVLSGPGALTTDQRGENRQFGTSVDTGAVEYIPLDFGDAPAGYPVTFAENGARHIAVGPTFGATRDEDANGTHSTGATADGADEDGVTAAGPLIVGQTTNITINASAPGFVNAWADLNRDNDWNDPGEQFMVNLPVVVGDNVIPFSVPADFTPGNIVVRYRLTSASVVSPAPTGLLPDGEVEDYVGMIFRPPVATLEMTSVQARSGGQVNFEAVIHNVGSSNQSDNPGSEFEITVPSGLTFSSATATSGIVSLISGTVIWNGTIPAGQSVTVALSATVAPTVVPGSTLSLQGTVNFDADGNNTNESTVLTDDPATVPADPTVITVLESASLVVTTAADTVNDLDGLTSLREAITVANSDPDASEITFGNGSSLGGTDFTDNSADTVLLSFGEMTINQSVSIKGLSQTLTAIDAPVSGRIFSITGTDISVTIDSVTLQNGDNRGNFDGGTIHSTADGVSSLTILNSTVKDSLTERSGGAIFNENGAIVIRKSTFSGNTASEGSGGAVFSVNGTILIEDSTFSGNESTEKDGGAIYAENGTVTITNSTLSGNTADRDGGAIYALNPSIRLIQSTITDNTANSGGGIFLLALTGLNEVRIHNSIVAANHDAAGQPDIDSPIDVPLYVFNSLIGDKSGTGLLEDHTASLNTASLNNTTQAASYIGSVAGAGIINPLLAALADNGGPTKTHAMLPGSLTINAGNNSRATIDGEVGSATLANDQRGAGFPRLVGGTVDLGAFEFQFGFDFGDAPNSYPVTLAENGARHLATGPTLGATRDAETDGTHSADADADGADEDGVTAAGPLVVGQTTNVIINVQGGSGFVNAWSDLNRDGDWNDLGEQFLTNFAVSAGDNVIPFSVPNGFTPGNIVNRFRLTSASVASPAPTGALPDGEVEDYIDTILEAPSFVVTTASDIVSNTDGLTSLREAILYANSRLGTDTITFAISGSAPRTIRPMSALPTITDRAIIDGTSNPGYSGKPVIELDGTLAGPLVSGLKITAVGSTVRGLAINRFSGAGVELRSGGGNTIEGNFIGTDVGGTLDRGNAQDGVLIVNSPNNRIGNATAAKRNVISGNDWYGVRIFGSSSTGNVVTNNYIGTNAAGNGAIGNSLSGVLVSNAPSNTIGGVGAALRNVISGNAGNGVFLIGAATTGMLVQGNFIGTNAAGTVTLGNSRNGLMISDAPSNMIGGTVAGARNVISGNGSRGVIISGAGSTGNLVQGNYIGTDVTGTVDRGNSFSGVRLDGGASSNTIGGLTSSARNLISGNDGHGIRIFGIGTNGNVVQGNSIGTDITRMANLGNRGNGVMIDGGASSSSIGGVAAGAANRIAFNGINGVRITGNGSGHAILRNSISLNGGRGIDLNGDGLTANDAGDADSGPNNLQNFPVITSVVLSGANLNITFSVPSVAPNSTFPLRIEFFITDSANLSGHTFLGTVSYTTAGSRTVTIPAGSAVSGTRIVATATDNNGAGSTSEFSANRIVANALLAAGGSARAAKAEAILTASQLRPIVRSAITRMAAQGFTSTQISQLSSVTVEIADLPGALIGLATPGSITLDTNAAGYGWYIDATPLDDAEFTSLAIGRAEWKVATGTMDLLSAVMHELGHVLGRHHSESSHGNDAMSPTLAPGIRLASLLEATDEPSFRATSIERSRIPAIGAVRSEGTIFRTFNNQQMAPADAVSGGVNGIRSRTPATVKQGSIKDINGSSISVARSDFATGNATHGKGTTNALGGTITGTVLDLIFSNFDTWL